MKLQELHIENGLHPKAVFLVTFVDFKTGVQDVSLLTGEEIMLEIDTMIDNYNADHSWENLNPNANLFEKFAAFFKAYKNEFSYKIYQPSALETVHA